MIEYIPEYFKGRSPNIEAWDEPTQRIFKGKTVLGRPTRGYGSTSFNYAGKLYEPSPWTDTMYTFKQDVEKLVWRRLGIDKQFTFCLCGFYGTDGRGIPHHSDTVPTEKDLVVSISLGAPRIFIQRTYQNPIKKHTNTSEIFLKENFVIDEKYYILQDGDVLIFDGKNQLYSTHSVPDLQETNERVNLTFRSGL
jgi:alkylated DNA repair dioxygenase AlkB